MSDLIKKTKIVPFINTGTKASPTWTQIKKSTSFTLSMNPQTQTFDFISSETPQNEIESYQPSLSQSLTMFKGEPDYEHIFNMLYNRLTGDDAHRDVLIVFYKEKGTKTTTGTTNKDVYTITSDTSVDTSKDYYTVSDGVYTKVENPTDDDISDYYEKTTTTEETSIETPIYKAWKVDSLVTINQLDSTNENIDFDLALNDITNGAVETVDGSPVFTAGEWYDNDFSAA